MPTTANAKASGHDAGFTLVEAEPVSAPFKIEGDDGWTVGAGSPEELRDLIAEKLRQAEQTLADAHVAVDRWKAAAKAAR